MLNQWTFEYYDASHCNLLGNRIYEYKPAAYNITGRWTVTHAKVVLR